MKKRVLFYNGQLFMGGIERVLISYLQGLANEEELEITALIKENDPDKNIFFKDIPKNLSVIFIKTEKMVKFRNKIKQNKKNIFCRLLYPLLLSYERLYMKKWIREFMRNNKDKFDVVIDFDMSLGKYLDEISLPKIGWVHYTLTKYTKSKKKYKSFEKRFEKYDKIVTICDEMKEEAKTLFNLSDKKIIRIYNPFDMERVKKSMENNLDLENNKKIEDKYMVAVSRLVKEKGREDLIEIYKELKKRGVKEKLYIIGDGPQKMELEKKIKKLQLEQDVFLLGQKKNPFPLMKNATLFLHTSYGEGLGMVFIESIICGTAIVAYDCPTGPKDILGKNKYGVLIKTGDKKSFENEVFKLLKDEERRKKYIEDFYKEKLQEFDINCIKQQFKDMLSEIIKIEE